MATEMIEIRMPADVANRVLPRAAGERLSDDLRRLVVERGDAMFHRFEELRRNWRDSDGLLYFAAISHWKYSTEEIARASAVAIGMAVAFEPAGEECGTLYNESEACPQVLHAGETVIIGGMSVTIPSSICGVGGRQVGPLHLLARRIPKRPDIARTIAGEVVVSQRFAEMCRAHGLVGCSFGPIFDGRGAGGALTSHFQLRIDKTLDLTSRTRGAADPFDDSSRTRCPRGHLLGLVRTTQVYVRSSDLRGSDFFRSRQFFGSRRGVLRPEPVIMLSPRAWDAVIRAGLRGMEPECVGTDG